MENDFEAQSIIFVYFLFLGSIIPFASFAAIQTPFMAPNVRRLIWLIMGVVGFIVGVIATRPLVKNDTLIVLGVVQFILVYTVILIVQRLWFGQKIWGEVIRDISMTCLNWHTINPNLKHIPLLIGHSMRFDRVYILELTPDEQFLKVTAEFGEYNSVLNQKVPIDASITGRTFQEKKPVVWNHVRDCPYYHSIFANDDTKAEMAVPLIHQGVVYGILDVQASVKGAYTPRDLKALETIAGILGTAIALDKKEQFFHDAIDLWHHVMSADHQFETEEDVFELFAQFAQERLGADLIVYYPLSLAGYPVHKPYVRGNRSESAFATPPIQDQESKLLQYINKWEAYFAPDVKLPPLNKNRLRDESDNLIEQEAIKSACFLPVGVRQERLGALFLNFRHNKQFDQAFKFSVVSLSQSLASAAAQVRYRDLVFTSFARPEMNIHTLIGRYGFKNSLRASLNQTISTKRDEQLNQLLTQMDQFIVEIRLADSAHPPNFAQQSFLDQLQAFKSALPAQKGGRRPRLKLTIDPAIEREFPAIKLALYRVITESITNALVHGNAKRIEVNLTRKHHCIKVEIINNGEPLPPKAEEKQSENGIYSLLQECQDKLGAHTEIENLPKQKGVIVSTSVPTLPPRPAHDI